MLNTESTVLTPELSVGQAFDGGWKGACHKWNNKIM